MKDMKVIEANTFFSNSLSSETQVYFKEIYPR